MIIQSSNSGETVSVSVINNVPIPTAKIDGSHVAIGSFLMDSGTNEYVIASVLIPSNIDLTDQSVKITFSGHWGGVNGGVNFKVDYAFRTAGDSMVAAWDVSNEDIVIAADGTGNLEQLISKTFTLAAIANNDLVLVKLHRNNVAGGNTFNITGMKVELV